MCTTGNRLRIFSDCDPVQKAKVLPLHCSGSTTSSDPIHGDPSNWKVSRRYLSLQHSASSPGFQVQPPVLTLLWQSKPNRSTRRLQAPRFPAPGTGPPSTQVRGMVHKSCPASQHSVISPGPRAQELVIKPPHQEGYFLKPVITHMKLSNILGMGVYTGSLV